MHSAARDEGGSLIQYARRPPPDRCVFFSLRFGPEHGVVQMAEALRAALATHGVTAIIINMTAGGDISREVFQWIEHCETFVVFGFWMSSSPCTLAALAAASRFAFS